MERKPSSVCLWRLAIGSLCLMASANSLSAQPTFDDIFIHYDVPPQGYEVAEGAVDLDRIEPPIENRSSAQSLGEGGASFYGRKFNGRRTASGETFDMHAMTAAHRTLPFGSKVRVTNLANNRSVVVRINDRGPFSRSRIIDVSRAAAEEIGLVASGHGKVRIELVE